ncbi:MAG: WecB/TagA/CpsF family glycosyltransferase [Candidatus Roizmanbacteria bacterium]|nr:WecB/TagA/CpsF family glycosyltransferase [Candidatus Roizmanbacteria bacterium]
MYSNKDHRKALNFLGSNLIFLDKKDILELFLKNKQQVQEMVHIVSINPENVVCMKQDKVFERVVTKAQGHIPDGIGIVIAAQILYGRNVSRLTGVDTMEYLLTVAGNQRMRAVLIGGRSKLAESIANCYKKRYPGFEITGIEGYKDIRKCKNAETEGIFHIVSTAKPHLVFVAFGSPWQEKWIDDHRTQFTGSVVMGVGGSFDLLSKSLVRAPILLQKFGLEWLFRLIQEPHRFRRQLQLVVYIKYVIQECITRMRLWDN